jgi:surface protein
MICLTFFKSCLPLKRNYKREAVFDTLSNILPNEIILHILQFVPYDLNDANIHFAVRGWFLQKDVTEKIYGPIGEWDTRAVTNMSRLFHDCNFFNENINRWDVSNVTNMSSMFTFCERFNQPLFSWDVSNVTNMSFMFRGCTEFDKSLECWSTENVTSMFTMCLCFNQPVESWDVSKVVDMANMFHTARQFNQPLEGWDVSNVMIMDNMFQNCSSFNQSLDSWNVSNVTSMSGIFRNCCLARHRENTPNWNFNGDLVRELEYNYMMKPSSDHDGGAPSRSGGSKLCYAFQYGRNIILVVV